jgi:hypothetical protein
MITRLPRSNQRGLCGFILVLAAFCQILQHSLSSICRQNRKPTKQPSPKKELIGISSQSAPRVLTSTATVEVTTEFHPAPFKEYFSVVADLSKKREWNNDEPSMIEP